MSEYSREAVVTRLRIHAEKLISEFRYWGEHPDWPVADWRQEVVNDDTRESYWEWVAKQIECQAIYNDATEGES